MPDLSWKIVERIEEITEHLEEIQDYLEHVSTVHEVFNTWIQTATESLTQLQKQVKYLNNKKDAI